MEPINGAGMPSGLPPNPEGAKARSRLSGSLGFQASLTAFTHFLLLPIGILSVIVVGRLVGPQGKGILTALLLVPTVLPTLGLFSITNGLIYYAGSEPDQKRRYQASALFFGLGLAAIYGLALWICRSLVWDSLLKQIPYSEVLATSMVTAGTLMVINAVFMGYSLSQRDVSRYNLALFTNPTLKLLLVLAALLLPVYLRLDWLAWAAVLGLAAATAVYAPSALKVLGSARPSWSHLGRMLRFSLKSFWGGAIQKMDHVLAKFMVAAFLSPADLGYYAVSLLLTTPVTLAPSAISPVVMPYAAAERGANADEKLFALARIALWFMIFASVLLAPVMYLVIAFGFGPKFMPALVPSYLLLPGMLALGHAKILDRFLTARGHPSEASISSLVSLIGTAASLLLLMPPLGVAGAAIATSLGYIFYDLSLHFFLRKCEGCHLRRILLPQRSDLRLLAEVVRHILAKLLARFGMGANLGGGNQGG